MAWVRDCPGKGLTLDRGKNEAEANRDPISCDRGGVYFSCWLLTGSNKKQVKGRLVECYGLIPGWCHWS